MSHIIIRKLFGYRIKLTPLDSCELISVGSLMNNALEVVENNNVAVWGSGFIQEGRDNDLRNISKFKFHAVRGPITKDRLSLTNVILGDPALLTNLIIKPSKKKVSKIGVIPHYADAHLELIKMIEQDNRFIIIDPLHSPKKVIQQISSCSLVLSSSLHGLILSDTYSIPNMWLHLSDNLMGNEYKFKDYFSSINRTLESANLDKIFDQIYLDKIKKNYIPIKNLASIQQDLINSFPY